MNAENYQKELDAILADIQQTGRTPTLLLHSCCAPCSSYVLEYLSPYFAITDFFYNPNITEEEEYRKRAAELQRLIAQMPLKNPVFFSEGPYEPERFLNVAKGLEDAPEGGDRCSRCFTLRLFETAKKAAEGGFDFFTTTLTISPLKNAAKINEIGKVLGETYGVRFLPSDFKKRDGYLRSLALSKEYDLYRQDYCGCKFSKRNDCDTIAKN